MKICFYFRIRWIIYEVILKLKLDLIKLVNLYSNGPIKF